MCVCVCVWSDLDGGSSKHERLARAPALVDRREDRKQAAREEAVALIHAVAVLARRGARHHAGWAEHRVRLAAARLAVCHHVDVDAGKEGVDALRHERVEERLVVHVRRDHVRWVVKGPAIDGDARWVGGKGDG